MGSPLRPTEAEALAEWRRLVEADYEQVTRLREPAPAADHYAPIARRFRPGGLPSPELAVLESLVLPGETWLDVGAGGGRFAVPLARRVGRYIAIEPSQSMREQLSAAVSEAGGGIEVRDVRWPDEGWREDADVVLSTHVLYDIRAAGAFLEAMERHARRLCVVSLMERARGAHLAELWEAVHGEPMATLPALRELVALLGARGRRFEVHSVAGERPEPLERDEALAAARRFLWLAPESGKDRRMQELLVEWYGLGDGRVQLPAMRRWIGVVTWTP